jgi:competence protein ComEC
MSWQVDFWDVGQGDATSIKLPTGEYVLIDTGPGPATNNPIAQWFCANPTARPISAVAVTHNDADHAGGLHSLAMDSALKIETVYLVHDPKTKGACANFAALMDPLRRRKLSNRTQTLTLQSGTILAEDDDLRLIARHPDFISAYDAKTPNSASSILSLESKKDDKVFIVWGGDALLKTIGSLYKNGMPSILMGPHHGAPQDKPSTSIEFAKKLRLIAPQTLFVSVGSSNRHDHPNRDFIVGASKKGIGVCCSQITKKCLREGQKAKPIFQGSGRLGLPAPAGSVPCRGTMRVFASTSGVMYDRLQGEYSSVLTAVDRALCKRCNATP